jgi:hypothetical protein
VLARVLRGSVFVSTKRILLNQLDRRRVSSTTKARCDVSLLRRVDSTTTNSTISESSDLRQSPRDLSSRLLGPFHSARTVLYALVSGNPGLSAKLFLPSHIVPSRFSCRFERFSTSLWPEAIP